MTLLVEATEIESSAFAQCCANLFSFDCDPPFCPSD